VSKLRIDRTSQIWGIHINVHLCNRGTITDADSLNGLLNLESVALATCTSCGCVRVDHISLLQLEDELLGGGGGWNVMGTARDQGINPKVAKYRFNRKEIKLGMNK
jgi:hypothetical protein